MNTAQTTTLPIAPETFWGVVAVGGLIFACYIIFVLLPRATQGEPPLLHLRRQMGLDALHEGPFLIATLLWLALTAMLTAGLFGLVWDILWHEVPNRNDTPAVWDWRFKLVQITALTTVLGAVVVLPITLNRMRVAQKQVDIDEQGHITDRINTAVQGLGAEKSVDRVGRAVTVFTGYPKKSTVQVENPDEFELPPKSQLVKRYHDITMVGNPESSNDLFEGQHFDIETWSEEKTDIEWRNKSLSIADREVVSSRGDWQVFSETLPNLEVRIGAIYALERIAQDSDRDHVQIMQILCAYIREIAPKELATGYPPEWVERGADNLPDAEDIREWADSLKTPRTDIQVALTVIGRRSPRQIALEGSKDEKGDWQGYRLDLRDTCLQQADLSKATLNHAKLKGARMQGADLFKAKLDNVVLTGARMQGADLSGARMQGAYLSGARMQGANLSGARMQGANLSGARMQGAYVIETRMQEAYLIGARMQGADLSGARMQGAFLRGARMQGADLSGARMQGAYVIETRMQGAFLSGARMDATTLLTAALLRGAAVRSVDFTNSTIEQDQIDSVFGDQTVTLPDRLTRPTHWPEIDEDDLDAFDDQWRAWQTEIGFDPDDPTT